MYKRKNVRTPNMEAKRHIIDKNDLVKRKKHSLDSDEEDENDDEDNVLSEDDIEGEEDGEAYNKDGIRTTAFNMREELEEGHFDKDGHFVWKKDKQIRDNWLDNIDWQQISNQGSTKSTELNDSNSESEDENPNTEIKKKECYTQLLKYMKPKESIEKTLRRLGSNKMSSVQRLKLKKAGMLTSNTEDITNLTEIANELLRLTGNMDIYQETYESIDTKLKKMNEEENKVIKNTELDMYSDDFEEKERHKLEDAGPSTETKVEEDKDINEVTWEIKWKKDSSEIKGPYTTLQMQNWVEDGQFKDEVWVRRKGQEQFYSSKRVDFELYLG